MSPPRSASGVPPQGGAASGPAAPDPRRSLDVEALATVVDESVWLDVIRKMDEVYTQLVTDEVALEAQNAELERQQRFIMSLLSSMSDVLVACNEDGQIEETNAALCELVGRSEEALRGTALAALVADEVSGARLRHALHTVLQERSAATVEIDLLDAQGQRVPVDFNCTTRRSAGGRRAGHVLVGRPLGDIKRAYVALREAHEALKRTQAQLLHSEKMASLGRLVAGVAHELNNPISFVLGNVRALQKYGDRLARYLDAVHGGADAAALASLRRELRIDGALADLPNALDGLQEGAQRTADIVAGLKRFSAMDREERGELDLREVVERAIHWVRKGTAPGFTVDWQPGDEPLTVHGNAGQLLQVLMNLIQNAVDATAGRADARLTVRAARDAARVQIAFEDNGPGIDPAALPRVFDPFFTTKPVGQGTGLGLSISYGIVDQHGGRLAADNAAAGGAVFTLELPRADPG
ncbi:MAG TPA: ATP-binding protein [Burkholderiaceae bacterium]|nr:ATP-binding protein [Burkholderiaceae bacterium]